MKTGKVLWFNEVKGYGFIAQDDKSEDIFVHFRSLNIVDDKRIELKKNQKVSYEVADGIKGLHAINVSLI